MRGVLTPPTLPSYTGIVLVVCACWSTSFPTPFPTFIVRVSVSHGLGALIRVLTVLCSAYQIISHTASTHPRQYMKPSHGRFSKNDSWVIFNKITSSSMTLSEGNRHSCRICSANERYFHIKSFGGEIFSASYISLTGLI